MPLSVSRPALRSRAARVGSYEPGVADFPRRDQPDLLSALNLAVYRWMRRTGELRDLGEAQLAIGITEQERKNLALLPRSS
jgi:hypothetical protein